MPDGHKPTICTMRIVFLVDTDEEAFKYKKEIGEAVSKMPEGQLTFTMSPNRIPTGTGNELFRR